MTTTTNLSTTPSSTLAVLSRLRALELQVGLLDINNNANYAIDDDDDDASSSPQRLLQSSSSSKNNVVTRLEALEHQALNLWTTNSSSSTATVTTTTSSSPSGTTATLASTVTAISNSNSNAMMMSMGLAWKETWLESERLFAELDPATALTHQQHSLTGAVAMAPILYRRQQVLCSAELLRHNMRLVSQILNLLLIGSSSGGGGSACQALSNTSSTSASNKSTRTTSAGGGGSSSGGGASGTGTTSHQQQQQQQQLSMITEEQVVQAPILVLTTTTGNDDTSMEEENAKRLTRVEKATLNLQARTKVVASRLDRLLTSYQSLVATFSEQVVILDEQVRQHEKKKR